MRTVRDTYPVLKLLYAVPNGGDRNLRVVRKLKAEGVLAGVSDLCLPAARRGYHGLYLEMKSEEGIATEEQKEFLRAVSKEGYCAVIAQGVDEARATLEWYIGITDNEPPSLLKTNLICQSDTSASRGGVVKRRNNRRQSFLRTTTRLKIDAVGSGAMTTSNSNVFCRVNRRKPCRICGKPDWCSYVRDGERISICMRVSDDLARTE